MLVCVTTCTDAIATTYEYARPLSNRFCYAVPTVMVVWRLDSLTVLALSVQVRQPHRRQQYWRSTTGYTVNG